MIELLYVFIGLFTLLYFYLTWINSYWKKKGIAQINPLPVIGNLWDVLTNKKNVMFVHMDAYNKYPNEPVVGLYQMTKPYLLLKSPELIQKVLVKDFSSFYDNYLLINEKRDRFVYRDPFFSRGPDWKFHRSAIVPSLTATKVKAVFPQMKEIANELEEYLNNTLTKDHEAKQLAFDFTVDIVSNCAFGIHGNSFKGTEEVFSKMGKMMSDHFKSPLVSLMTHSIPFLTNIFKLNVVPEPVGDFLKSVILQSAEYRKKNNVERNDFLQHILNLRGKKQSQEINREYSIDDVVGYAMTFFIEGFETSAITASFALYELACNPDIQEILRTEIYSVVTKCEDLDYENLHSMLYLDKVISETLRKYPILLSMTRVCTRDTVFEIGGKKISIEKGTPIIIPVYSLQNDPNYYPRPEKFDPERFSQDSASRTSYTYMPFGEGPRICIGMKFGLTQVKLFLIAILLKFEVLPSNKSTKDIGIDEKAFLTSSKDPLNIRFKKIEV